MQSRSLLRWYRALGSAPFLLFAALLLVMKYSDGRGEPNELISLAGLTLMAAWGIVFCLSGFTLAFTLFRFRRVALLFADHALDRLALYSSLLWFCFGTLLSAVIAQVVLSPGGC